VPFINSKAFIDRIKNDGIPVVREKTITIPFDIFDYQIIELKLGEINKGQTFHPQMDNIIALAPLIVPLFYTLGINLKEKDSESNLELLQDLIFSKN
jgi:hypothetical protein